MISNQIVNCGTLIDQKNVLDIFNVISVTAQDKGVLFRFASSNFELFLKSALKQVESVFPDLLRVHHS